jgi:dolichol-phosphate mannosyltransferase
MIYILLPAYNEERDIGSLLVRIRESMLAQGFFHYTVLVVNDGSTDKTHSIATELQQQMPIALLNHGVNLGLGRAMLTGLSRAAELVQDEDVLVTMDADNTHDPCLIGSMVAKIQSGADLVIASRYEKGGEEIGLSKARSVLSRGASLLLHIFFPIPDVKDYTCGFRAYNGLALKKAFQVYGLKLVEERGFTCMAEILLKLRVLGVRVGEVPLVLRYDLKSGRSKLKIGRTILRYGVLVARNLFRKPMAAQQQIQRRKRFGLSEADKGAEI